MTTLDNDGTRSKTPGIPLRCYGFTRPDEALPADIAAALRDLPDDHLPRNARLGNGSPIPDSDIATINDTFTACSWAEPWQQGDLILVDNTTVAHGRRPYQGHRQVLVAMAGAVQ
ncbi:TauD/TfdA family dioxygenase [Streptomyces sp. NPDC088124]|uniref:TauD/TfdA family dioxygenase n=1 Tax=Streptomyces sp. NPDC088124 TaxID=3154654 RepID=UPI0034200D15